MRVELRREERRVELRREEGRVELRKGGRRVEGCIYKNVRGIH